MSLKAATARRGMERRSFSAPQRLAHGGVGERQWRGVPARVPQQLFTAPSNNRWDVTSDGKRFLVDVQPGEQNGQAPITVKVRPTRTTPMSQALTGNQGFI